MRAQSIVFWGVHFLKSCSLLGWVVSSSKSTEIQSQGGKGFFFPLQCHKQLIFGRQLIDVLV